MNGVCASIGHYFRPHPIQFRRKRNGQIILFVFLHSRIAPAQLQSLFFNHDHISYFCLIPSILELVTIPNVFNYLKRPEYVFRPRQVVNRLRRSGKAVPPVALVNLPWGAPLKVRTDDAVGREIFFYGLFDRIVPEAIYRLADAGELSVEAGANIGQNCSLMAAKKNAQGRVIAFEPHPEIFEELKFNFSLWPESMSRNVQLENCALGETTGEAWLVDGSHFHRNRGTASLCQDNSENAQSRRYKVNVRRLDEFIPSPATVGVCKIDVEGHEIAVLKGAEQALSRGAIRDIIFEEFAAMPSPTVKLLRKYQYKVFRLTATWWKPILTEIDQGLTPPGGINHNYLATLNPQRATNKFRSVGWHCLMFRPASA